MNKIKIILELDVSTPENNNIYNYRKNAAINMFPFPGLIVDDDSTFNKKHSGIVDHSVTIEKIRTSMVSDSILCYCKKEIFETEKLLLEHISLLKKFDWHASGFPG
jgi:hypothetical protein